MKNLRLIFPHLQRVATHRCGLLVCFVLMLLGAVSTSYAQQGRNAPKLEFYAEISADRPQLFVEDSCVISVMLYANLPFETIEQAPRKLVFPKGLKVRELPTARESQLVRTPRGVFYGLLWQQYRVSRKDVGKIEWPNMQFHAELGVYQSIDDGWGDFFSFSPQLCLVEKHKVSCKLPRFSLPVVERPKRSTQDLLRSGQQVM